MPLNEIVVTILSTVIPIITSIAMLAYWLGKKFAEINERFRLIDEGFRLIDERFKLIDDRFKSIDERFRSIERAFRVLMNASAEAHRIIIDFLSIKGIIGRDEAEYLSKRIRGIFSVYAIQTNPLTKEEWKFLKEFFDRAATNVDDVTIEEAEKAYELGLKLFVEDFDEKGFLIAIAAAYIRGYLVSKEVRKRKEERRTPI